MEIKKYTSKDYEPLVKLVDEFNKSLVKIDSWKNRVDFSGPEQAGRYVDKMLEYMKEKEGIIILAFDKDIPVGFIEGIIERNQDDIYHTLTSSAYTDGWVGHVYVKPEFRKKGVGKQLIENINMYFIDKKCRYSRLLVLDENTAPKELYSKLGYQNRNVEMAKEL